jgi:hypothetical protein
LTTALTLNKISELREGLYLLSVIYNLLPNSGPTNHRRDIAAQLFLIADKEFKR